MNKHLFSHQVLSESKIKIYSGNQNIMPSSDAKLYSLDPLFKSSFILHRFVSLDKKQTKFIEKYDDLIRMGFQISKKRVMGKYFIGQKVEYFIVKTSSGYPHLGYIPQNHQVQYNFVENWIKLIGPNSAGTRVFLKRQNRPTTYNKEMELEDYANFDSEYYEDIYPFTLVEKEERMQIEEIPILKTADGIIVCLPQMVDNPTIGIFGKKGRGKSLLLHRIMDCVYHKWNHRVIFLNETTPHQTKSWSLPWDYTKHKFFTNQLKQIGEKTVPLPCVYLYPSVQNIGNIDFENEVSFKMSLSFKDIMQNPNSFLEDTSDKLNKSEKYLKNLIFDNRLKIRPDGLLYLNSQNPMDDVIRLVNEKVWVEQEITSGNDILISRKQEFVIPENSRALIVGLIKELLSSRNFDVNTDIPSKWIVEFEGDKYPFYPWDACLFAGVIPVIVTRKLREEKYFGPYLRFILNDIFQNQTEDTIIRRNNLEVWIFIDEIQDLLSYPPALQSFRKVNKEARNYRMGICYATQFFGDIPEDIFLTTEYVITFQQIATKASELGKNFNALAHQIKDMLTLKSFEAMISGKLLITYDTDGNREEINDGTPFKGTIFPSVSQHSAPKEVGI